MPESLAQLKATHALHGTTDVRGSIFTPGPTLENPPKRYYVAKVQKNYVSILFERTIRGKVNSTQLQRRNAAFIPMFERQGLISAEVGKLYPRELVTMGMLFALKVSLHHFGLSKQAEWAATHEC